MAYRAGCEITGKEYGGRGFGGIAAYPAGRGHGMALSSFWKFVNGEGVNVDLSTDHFTLEYEVHAGRGPVSWNLDAASSKDLDKILRHIEMAGTALELERAGVDVTQGGKIPVVGGGWLGGSVQGGGGGLWPVNDRCASTLPGLFAAGDSCGTRQVGSSYPGKGFALAHAAVTGYRAGMGAAEYAERVSEVRVSARRLAGLTRVLYEPMKRRGGFTPRWVTQQIQNLMVPYYAWQIKDGSRMAATFTLLDFVQKELVAKLVARDPHELRLAHETKNMALNALMMLKAAMFRTESRGTHYREDYPYREDPEWLAWTKISHEDGAMRVWKDPIPTKWRPRTDMSYAETYPYRFPKELVAKSRS